MAQRRCFYIQLPATQTGLTLQARLFDAAAPPVQVGANITTGFTEIGSGAYFWDYSSFPDNHRGSVRWHNNSGGAYLGGAAINPEEFEYIPKGLRALGAKLAGLTGATDLFTGSTFDNSTDALEALRDFLNAGIPAQAPAGAYSKVLTFQDGAGAPINGASVTFWNSGMTTVIGTLVTNAAGQLTFSQDAGDYKVVVKTTTAFANFSTQTLAMANNNPVTYTLSRRTISPAAAPGICIVYGYEYLAGQPVEGRRVTAKMLKAGAYTATTIQEQTTMSDESGPDGRWELHLPRTDQFVVGDGKFLIQIPEAGINKTITVPNQDSVDLRTLL